MGNEIGNAGTAVGCEIKPLDESELRRLWRWERAMVRLAAMAIMVIAVGLGAAQIYGTVSWVRPVVLAIGIALIAAVLAMQFRERCPRCRARLATGLMLMLPVRCGTCGVEIPRPINASGELDN